MLNERKRSWNSRAQPSNLHLLRISISYIFHIIYLPKYFGLHQTKQNKLRCKSELSTESSEDIWPILKEWFCMCQITKIIQPHLSTHLDIDIFSFDNAGFTILKYLNFECWLLFHLLYLTINKKSQQYRFSQFIFVLCTIFLIKVFNRKKRERKLCTKALK